MQAECASLRGLLHDMQRQLQETQAQLVEAQLAAGERGGLQQQLSGVQEQLQEAQSGLEERDALQLQLSGVQIQLQAAESAVQERDGLQQQLARVQAQLQEANRELAGGHSHESLRQELALSDANTAGLAMERSQLQHEVGPAMHSAELGCSAFLPGWCSSECCTAAFYLVGPATHVAM